MHTNLCLQVATLDLLFLVKQETAFQNQTGQHVALKKIWKNLKFVDGLFLLNFDAMSLASYCCETADDELPHPLQELSTPVLSNA
jgi:hypothetical protein